MSKRRTSRLPLEKLRKLNLFAASTTSVVLTSKSKRLSFQYFVPPRKRVQTSFLFWKNLTLPSSHSSSLCFPMYLSLSHLNLFKSYLSHIFTINVPRCQHPLLNKSECIIRRFDYMFNVTSVVSFCDYVAKSLVPREQVV